MDRDCEVHTHLIWNDIVAAITNSTRRLHTNDGWLREYAWRQGNQYPNGHENAMRTPHINYQKISVSRSRSNTRWSLQIAMFWNVLYCMLLFLRICGESGIIAPMKASLWLSIVILLGVGSLQAQTVYHPGQVIHVSVTFDGPYVVKLKGVQVLASIPQTNRTEYVRCVLSGS